ncbi:hypothetical protein F5Y14DRAFT_405963 [Nemania sp. NC0429]|nr:hypothetical protein F5Y14DRAFT_405963 [Nemania sp. NC0429]
MVHRQSIIVLAELLWIIDAWKPPLTLQNAFSSFIDWNRALFETRPSLSMRSTVLRHSRCDINHSGINQQKVKKTGVFYLCQARGAAEDPWTI